MNKYLLRVRISSIYINSSIINQFLNLSKLVFFLLFLTFSFCLLFLWLGIDVNYLLQTSWIIIPLFLIFLGCLSFTYLFRSLRVKYLSNIIRSSSANPGEGFENEEKEQTEFKTSNKKTGLFMLAQIDENHKLSGVKLKKKKLGKPLRLMPALIEKTHEDKTSQRKSGTQLSFIPKQISRLSNLSNYKGDVESPS